MTPTSRRPPRTQTLDTDVEFANVYKLDEKTGTVYSLTGGDHKSKKFKNVAETTNEAYSAAAGAVLGQATGTLAKLFAANPSVQ